MFPMTLLVWVTMIHSCQIDVEANLSGKDAKQLDASMSASTPSAKLIVL
jgi:hypothetical protein